MKNTKKKLKNQSKVVKYSFTGSNITKYSGLNTVSKYMNRQHIVKSISSSFPTEWHNATKFGINQILLAITLASISGINRICRIAAFSGDGLVKALLRLDKAINENAISATLKNLGQSGARKLQMFFSRQGTNGKWRVFITTDTELSFIRMIEIYQIRWTVEVFFKEAKQLLGLGRCQSTDFDAQIADTTITMIQHILLTLKYRFEHYETKGALFNQVREGIIESRLDKRLWGLFIELIRLLEVLFEGIDDRTIAAKGARAAKSSLTENEKVKILIY
jgi:hypothetical protein